MPFSRIIAPLILWLCAGWLAGCSPAENAALRKKPDPAVPITVAPVKIVLMDRAIPIAGTLFPKDEATISAEVEGRVEKTMVEFGDRILAGQVIAQIDTTYYDALALQAAANLAKAKATAANAEQNLKRLNELRKNDIASPSDLDKATAESEQALAEVKAAEATEAIARLNLEKSHVKTPFDAAVAERIASAGDFVRVGSPLFRVVNDHVLKYIVQAPERYAHDVKKDQSVVFTVDAWPGETFEGKVYLISPSVNTTRRDFALGALVHNPDQKLKASTFARGELVLDRQTPTMLIPLDAVISFAGVTKVFIVDHGVAFSREVETGRIKDGQQQIVAGLKEGEIVVVSGQTKLFDGAKVRVKNDAMSSDQ